MIERLLISVLLAVAHEFSRRGNTITFFVHDVDGSNAPKGYEPFDGNSLDYKFDDRSLGSVHLFVKTDA